MVDAVENAGFSLEGSRPKVEKPSSEEYGDYATNVALELGSREDLNPRQLAEQIVTRLNKEFFDKVEIAGPGFINFFLSQDLLIDSLSSILSTGITPSQTTDQLPDFLQIEFVSSNPTGPLTVGHGRQAVLGDILASIYSWLGIEVTTEYYFNDEGRQMDLLAKSLWVRYRQAQGEDIPLPEDGYKGDYLIQLGQKIASRQGEKYDTWDQETADFFKSTGLEHMVDRIKTDLSGLGISFDRWFRESELHERGLVSDTLQELENRDGTYEENGAVWLKAEEQGAPKDVVLIKSNGEPTYLLPDIAYHRDKYARGYDKAIVLLGADHQRHVENLNAALKILDLPDSFYEVHLNQFVSLVQEGEVRRMSTREGEFVPLSELVDDLGKDVVRYFMADRKPETHLEFDYDLAKQESMDNPVYYLQYAHTRIASIFRNADIDPGSFQWQELDLTPLTHAEEIRLVKKMDEFSSMIVHAAVDYAPQAITKYGEDLATLFHQFYNRHKVLCSDENTAHARLALCRAVQLTVRKTLNLLGVTAPTKM